MEQTENQPIYWDKHRIPFNLTLVFAFGVAAFGIVQLLQGSDNGLLLGAGLLVAAYSWFTVPKQYVIFSDRVQVVYGRPRVKIIFFADVSRLEMRQLATPDRLRVWPKSGRRVVLMAKDVEAFYEQLDRALGDYRRLHPDEFYDDDAPASGSAIIDAPVVERPPAASDQPASDQSPTDNPDNPENVSPY